MVLRPLLDPQLNPKGKSRQVFGSMEDITSWSAGRKRTCKRRPQRGGQPPIKVRVDAIIHLHDYLKEKLQAFPGGVRYLHARFLFFVHVRGKVSLLKLLFENLPPSLRAQAQALHLCLEAFDRVMPR